MIKERIILVADDDVDDQELLEEAILHLKEGAAIHTVSSGNELIEYLISCTKKELPCLIVLDYNMPKMNGVEVLEYLHNNENYKHIPAIVWSTSNSIFYKEICKQKGALEYFQKPNNFTTLTAVAKQMLSFCSRS